MSCRCAVCYETIAQPNSLWYAALQASFMSCWICGECLSLIPAEDRIPTEKQRDRDVTFGPMRADVNSRGWYQNSGSSRMAPRFWVTAEALERAFPLDCELMAEYYPYIFTERFLREMVKAEREGIWPPERWDGRSREQLLMQFGSHIRKHLGLPPAPEVEDCPVFNLNGSPVHVPPGQARLAEALWQEIRVWSES